MERIAKSFHQLKLAHSIDLRGRSRNYLCSPEDKFSTSDLFSTKAPPEKPFLPPSFHVPAIIDALRLSHRYQQLVRLVPGEADAYCAQHLLKLGGTVLTSDSDLLVHDLGLGRVVFLRDIYLDGASSLAGVFFSPSLICEKLGLLSSDQIRRIGYERRQNPNQSFPQILQECLKPIKHLDLYTEFCQEYTHHETAPLPTSEAGTPIQIGALDPRLSELVLQFQNSDDMEDITSCKMFLPILIEGPFQGSAWEQSTTVRQLAYTVLRQLIPGHCSSVQEYRRVNNTAQKGRSLNLLNKDSAEEFVGVLVDLMDGIQNTGDNDSELSWLLCCLILDIRHCRAEDKQSHCLQMLQSAARTRSYDKVSWDVIHFAAQLQAAYYSFRMLSQITSLVPATETKLGLHDLLVSLPPLTQSPDIECAIKLLSGEHAKVLAIVKRLVPVPEELPKEPKRTGPGRPKTSRSQGRRVTKKTPARSGASQNPFEFLAQHD